MTPAREPAKTLHLTESELVEGAELLLQALYEGLPSTGKFTAVPIYVEQGTAIALYKFYNRVTPKAQPKILKEKS